MRQLLSHIQTLHPLSPEAQSAIQHSFEEKVLSKNESLLTEGKTCKHLYFICQGAIRGYYTLEGKEITYWFGLENDFVASFHSFINGEPAVENIQVLEGCVLGIIASYLGISQETLSWVRGRK